MYNLVSIKGIETGSCNEYVVTLQGQLLEMFEIELIMLRDKSVVQ